MGKGLKKIGGIFKGPVRSILVREMLKLMQGLRTGRIRFEYEPIDIRNKFIVCDHSIFMMDAVFTTLFFQSLALGTDQIVNLVVADRNLVKHTDQMYPNIRLIPTGGSVDQIIQKLRAGETIVMFVGYGFPEGFLHSSGSRVIYEATAYTPTYLRIRTNVRVPRMHLIRTFLRIPQIRQTALRSLSPYTPDPIRGVDYGLWSASRLVGTMRAIGKRRKFTVTFENSGTYGTYDDFFADRDYLFRYFWNKSDESDESARQAAHLCAIKTDLWKRTLEPIDVKGFFGKYI